MVITNVCMAQDTRNLLAGMILSVAIVAGMSATLRLTLGETAVASETTSILACVR